MIECTLQKAIELCKENGGLIHHKNQEHCGRHTADELKRYMNGGRIIFTPSDISRTWVYLPPKQSAFQKWNSGGMNFHKNRVEYEDRKTGWNAAIDEVINVLSDNSLMAGFGVIRELKES
jgi:hypothetical protein